MMKVRKRAKQTDETNGTGTTFLWGSCWSVSSFMCRFACGQLNAFSSLFFHFIVCHSLGSGIDEMSNIMENSFLDHQSS